MKSIKSKADFHKLVLDKDIISNELIDLDKFFSLLGLPRDSLSTRIKRYAAGANINMDNIFIDKKGRHSNYYADLLTVFKFSQYYREINLISGHGIREVNFQGKIDESQKVAYEVWHNMLDGCYSKKSDKAYRKENGCSVSDDWLFFNKFNDWFNVNYHSNFILNKDLLLSENKIYSELTCFLVPKIINDLLIEKEHGKSQYPIGVLFRKDRPENNFEATFKIDGKDNHIGFYKTLEDASGAYKVAKVNAIKVLADDYFNKKLIGKKLHDLLYLYEVNIDYKKDISKKSLELMLLVSKKEDLMPYLKKYNLFDLEGNIDLREVGCNLGLSSHGYGNRIRWHIKKLNIPAERAVTRKIGRSKAIILNNEDAIDVIRSFTSTKLAYGHGINDFEGQVVFKEGIMPSYRKWCGMLERCYSDKWHALKPTYKDCFVSEEWLYFSNFKKWFDENNVDGYVLDKDILTKNNKEYSKETCVFIPEYINSIFIKKNASRGKWPIGVVKNKNKVKKFSSSVSHKGKIIDLGSFLTPQDAFLAYKKAKEDYVSEVATKYLKDELIGIDVYNAMLNYEVSIHD